MARRPWYKPAPTYVPEPPVAAREPPPPEPEPMAVTEEMPKVKRRSRRRVTTVDGPDPIDVHVGQRVRLRRTLIGMSQEKLGEAIGLTFQQVQKYERGKNRISASTLHRLSGMLDVPVSFFFDDMPEDLAVAPTAEADDTLMRRESLELLRAYYRLPEEARRGIYQLVKATAKVED